MMRPETWALVGFAAGLLWASYRVRAPACDDSQPDGVRRLVARGLNERILAAVPPKVATTGAMRDAARAGSNCAARTLDLRDAFELAGAWGGGS